MKLHQSCKTYFNLGLILGLFCGAILLCLTTPMLNTVSKLDKATAMYECSDHYGVFEITRLGYITCKDNHKPKYITQASSDVYMLYKIIDNKTYFGITFMDWKNYRSELDK